MTRFHQTRCALLETLCVVRRRGVAAHSAPRPATGTAAGWEDTWSSIGPKAYAAHGPARSRRAGGRRQGFRPGAPAGEVASATSRSRTRVGEVAVERHDLTVLLASEARGSTGCRSAGTTRAALPGPRRCLASAPWSTCAGRARRGGCRPSHRPLSRLGPAQEDASRLTERVGAGPHGPTYRRPPRELAHHPRQTPRPKHDLAPRGDDVPARRHHDGVRV